MTGAGDEWDRWRALPEQDRPHRSANEHDCFVLDCAGLLWRPDPDAYFILDEQGEALRISDSMESFRWHQNNEDRRQIGLADLASGIQVSTVLTRHDQNVTGVGPPKPFETMIFGGPYNEWKWHYSTRAAA